MSAKDPELCAKYCPGGSCRSDMGWIVAISRSSRLYGCPREAPLYIFDQYKEVSEKLKIFSVVVLEALLRSVDSPQGWVGALLNQDALEWVALWDCALAEAEELGAMAILHDKVLTLLY